jgi:hypothetical protein
MRPIVKPGLPDPAFAIPPSALLLQTFGEYCSVSEQPLPENHHVWHKALGVEHLGPVSPTDWPHLLLLSENSFLAQLGKAVPPNLLYPDDPPLTFSFVEQSPFKYSLEWVDTTYLDENGEQVGEGTKSQEVIVSGPNSDEAEATIAFFALNSQFFDARTFKFTIPLHAYRIGFDRRVKQRTKVWKMAVEFAHGSSDRFPIPLEHAPRQAFDQARGLAAATGYWSTWASALLHERVDRRAIAALLLPPRPPLPWEAGPGFHNPYPNTNPAVIP